MPLRDLLRVLVVDDMSTSRAILLQALDALGIRDTGFAAHGRAGLVQTQNDRPDLVLSDLYMPEMNGLELLQHIRADPSIAETGFILVTGRADDTVIQAGRELGMNNFITKPFTQAQFRDALEAVVGPL